MKSKTRKLCSSVLAFALSICMMLPVMSGVTFVAEAAENKVLNVSELTAGDVTEITSFGDFTVSANAEKKVTIDENQKVGDNGIEFTQRLKLGGSGSMEYRNVFFTTNGAATITVYAMSGSSSEDRPLLLMSADGTELARQMALGVAGEGGIITALTYEVDAAGTYYLWSEKSGINVYYIEIAEKAAASAGGAGKTMSINVSELETATISEFTTFGDFTVVANAEKTVVIDENKKIGDNGVEFTKRMKLGGAGSTELRSVSFTTGGAATVTLYAMSGSSSEDRPLLLMTADGTEVDRVTTLGVVEESIIPALTYEISEAGTYYIWSEKSGINIYAIEVKEAGGSATAAPSTLSANDVAAGDVTDITTWGDFTVYANADKKVTVDGNSKTGDNGMEFSQRIKLNGSGSVEARNISFTTKGAAKVNVYAMSGSSSEDRPLLLVGANGEVGRGTALGAPADGIIPAITYDVTEAGTYYIWSEKSGINIYYIEVVPEGAAVEGPARAAWGTVAAPVLGEASVENGIIKIPYTMLIGPATDGCDRLYITMYDAAGNEVEKQTLAAQSTGGTAEFAPAASGDYTFKCEAMRTDETTTIAGNEVAVKGYVLPLTTPVLASATSKGNGTVSVVWLPVDEAENYTVSYNEIGSDMVVEAGTTDAIEFMVTGLTVGTRYLFYVVANRGTDASAAGSIEANATAEAQRVWSFSTYGSSTKPENNWYEGSANDGSVTVASLNGSGKIVPGSTDGIAFYYTTIDPEKENFKLRAKFTVDEWKFSNGQDGFGMMVADAVGVNGDGSAFWNNYFSAVVSKVEYWWDYEKEEVVTGDTGTANKISMKLGVGSQEKRGVTAANIADGTIVSNTKDLFITNTEPLEYSQRYAAGTYNIVGNYTNDTKPTGTLGEKALKTEFIFEIERNNTGYYVSYITVDKDGVEQKETRRFYDLERTALTQIDPENIYVGFYAARNAKVTVTDIQFTTSDPATDAPAEERETTKIAPELAVNSAETTGNDDYVLNIYTNANGTIDVKGNSGEVYAEGVKATAETYTHITVKDLPTGLTNFRIYFTPDADFKFSEYEVLSSYETTEIQWAVSKKVFDMNVIYVAPNVDPSFTGKGTKDNPTDLNNAMEYAKEGQIIVLTEGTYKDFLSTITVGRGNDGTAENPIILMADPNAATRPVLDFDKKGSGMTIAGDYWILDGFDVTNSKDGSKGVTISGSNCIVQNVNTYKNGNSGINIGRWKGQDLWDEWPANNLVMNCTSWDNADVGYEDADGFACKLTVAEGNTFIGCIAHHNADDGWDLFGKIESGSIGSVTIKNCIAYGNGYMSDGTNAGNGNGFKMGGDSLPGNHKIYNSIAFDNKAKGIDSNSGPNIEIYNCTSFNNGGANVALYTNDRPDTAYVVDGLVSFRTDAMGVEETFKLKGSQDTTKVYGPNNYFYDATAQTAVNSEGKQADASWFVNLDSTTDVLTRNADGSINMNGFLQLTDAAAAGSGAVMNTAVAADGVEVVTANADYSGILAAAQAKDDEKAAAEVTPEPTVAPEATEAPTEAPEATTAPTEAPEEDEQDVPASSAGKGGIIAVIVIAAVAVAAAAIGAVLAKKKKGSKK